MTNAHVVDPFSTVAVSFPGGERHDNVPVAGSDVFADIALVGPIATSQPAQALAAHPQPEQGDDMYLVGYPGSETKPNPGVTISRGVLARVRTVDAFEQTYFQTDAAIGGGQSGGALVDGRGAVIGISGLLFADQFALALSSDDVTGAIGRIRGNTAYPYRPLPDGPDVTRGSAPLTPEDPATTLLIPAEPGDRTVDMAVPDSAQPIVDAETFFGDTLLVNQAAIDEYNAESNATDPSAAPVDLTATPPAAPNTWRFRVPSDEWALVRLATAGPAAVDVPFTATVPVRVYHDDDDPKPIKIGDRVLGTIDSLERDDTYLLDLAAGQTVTIAATSPQGDPLFGVIAPGRRLVDGTYTDDSNLGLYGTDAKSDFTAPAAGTYRVVVGVHDYVATGYALEITAS